MTFVIQDPTNPEGRHLLDVLIESCSAATAGGGAFAWANSRGLELLLENETFSTFVSTSAYDLIIGVDAVTDVPALEKLADVARANPNLTASVFLHERPGALFHPKFCWFRTPGGGILIVGSGNLTNFGLRASWEAFAVNHLNETQAAEIESTWRAWKQRHSELLRSPDDPAVLERASYNRGWERGTPRQVDALPDDIPEASETDANVLVMEVSVNRGRGSQVDVGTNNLITFFNERPGTPKEARRQYSFYPVHEDGAVGEEDRRGFFNKGSKNYGYELVDLRRKPEPRPWPPIVAILRFSEHSFLYQAVWPDHPDYQKVADFLNSRSPHNPRKMRREVTTIRELKQFWPDAPLWQALTEAE